ncbi:hypothetical protein M0811_04861 [Anaeramoeba ignava]|uniref:Uncharacterized protein n=1 Tax=Anaeramoeba ignava TaxID=1746090 RepID=A0A9Q0RF62_ANAIG|nr:hypothetical protein M0811_04861 [Anaeramoeba ignava]
MKLFFFLILLGLFSFVSSDCSWVDQNSSYESTCLSSPCWWCGDNSSGIWGYSCNDKQGWTCAQLKVSEYDDGPCEVFACLFSFVSSDCSWLGTDSSYESTCLSNPCYWCGIDSSGTWGYSCNNKGAATCAELKAINDQYNDCQAFACSFGSILSSTFLLFTSLIFLFF